MILSKTHIFAYKNYVIVLFINVHLMVISNFFIKVKHDIILLLLIYNIYR